MRRRITGGLASLVVAAALAGGVPGAANAAPVAGTTGSPTTVATLPAPKVAPYSADLPLVAGATGFLHQEQGVAGYLWSDYADGTDIPQPQLAALSATTTTFMSGGGDQVGYQSGSSLVVGDPATRVWTTYSGLPTGLVRGLGVNGTRAVVQRADGIHLLRLDPDGSTTELAVSGLPDVAAYISTAGLVDADMGGVALITSRPRSGTVGQAHSYLLRLDTGVAVLAPQSFPLVGGALSGGLLYYRSTAVGGGITTLSVFDVADVFAGTASVPAQSQFTLSGSLQADAVVGGHLLLATVPATGSQISTVLYSVPISGGTPTRVESLLNVAGRSNPLIQGPGGVLAVGGDATTSVQRFSSASDGTLSTATVRLLPPPVATTSTLTMDYGQVRQVLTVPQLDGSTRFAMFTTPLAANSNAASLPLGMGPVGGGYLKDQLGPCAVDASCVRLVDGGWYGPTYVSPAGLANAGDGILYNFGPGATVVDSDDEFEVVDQGGKQYVWEPGRHGVSSPVTATGAALWQGTLWRTSGPGQIQAVVERPGLPSAAVLRTISTGASCAPSELQVAQHWLYWSCGSTGPAGVYDLRTNARIPLAAGPLLLGDGFVVRHDVASGQLQATDVHTDAVGATTSLATFPANPSTADRGITWTVDRTSGDVAYADADNTVHVLTTGVPDSPVTAQTEQAADLVSPGTVGWSVSAVLSRPVSSWRFVVSRASTGQQVHVATGGPTPAELTTAWNGLTDAGKRPYDGDYTWQLWATPADDPTAPAALSGSGTVMVQYGIAPFHSYDEYGTPNLMGILAKDIPQYSAGEGFVYQGDGKGRLVNEGAYAPWDLGSGAAQVNSIVLFGDLNGDGVNDTLARTGTGVLRYYPGSQDDLGLNRSKPVTIGSGWNAYDQLASVGDLNGDGRDDLVARDRTGVLWFYAGNGHGGFAARVRVGTGWSGYARIVGVGDLNGDGAGDLLAVDGGGHLWRYLGNGHGGFGARTDLGAGYSVYSSVVGVGDLNGDGRNDFVARDRTGVLWQYDGTGKGGFAARIQVGTGWNMYSGLY